MYLARVWPVQTAPSTAINVYHQRPLQHSFLLKTQLGVWSRKYTVWGKVMRRKTSMESFEHSLQLGLLYLCECNLWLIAGGIFTINITKNMFGCISTLFGTILLGFATYMPIIRCDILTILILHWTNSMEIGESKCAILQYVYMYSVFDEI